ncbi:MAG: cyclic nucleotide-binding domain-containing protein [Aliarcobacter sp.]
MSGSSRGSSSRSSGQAGPSGPPKRSTQGPHLDIPPRTRNVLIVISLAGMICAVIGSLMARKGVAIEADKIVHFIGYSLLGCLMIMGLRPMFWVFGVVGVAGMSAALEAIQPIFGRSTDWSGDFVTNCIAVGTGAAAGLIGRFLWAYIRTEAVNAGIRKATLGFTDGQVVFKQGDPSEKFFIIRSGQVVLTREANGVTKEIAKAGPGEVVGEMGVLQKLPRSATATAKGRCWLYGMTEQDLMDKRSDGQDHPGSVVSRVLAQRLRKMTEQAEQSGNGSGEVNRPAGVAPAAAVAVQKAVAPVSTPVRAAGPKILLRMGWRRGEEVTWGDGVSEHSLPMAFGRNPGPSGMSAGTELVLLDENPPEWLSPLQFMVEHQNGAFILKDEQSQRGNEVSGVSVGQKAGVTAVELPAGTHVMIAGGEGSPYVMALEIPVLG